MSVSTPSPAGRKKELTERQTAARILLEHHAAELDRHRQDRIHFITHARSAGLTYAQIGDALGVTEAAVRFYVKRNGVAG